MISFFVSDANMDLQIKKREREFPEYSEFPVKLGSVGTCLYQYDNVCSDAQMRFLEFFLKKMVAPFVMFLCFLVLVGHILLMVKHCSVHMACSCAKTIYGLDTLKEHLTVIVLGIV